MDFFGTQDTILWYTNMLPKVFDRTVFVEFYISNNFEQNIDDETN
jgi:hypothetical protein